MTELRCPRCGGTNVRCESKPHRHLCLACGYDGRTWMNAPEPPGTAVEADEPPN